MGFVSSVPKCAKKISLVDEEVDKATVNKIAPESRV
jgi:hypothetical protein